MSAPKTKSLAQQEKLRADVVKLSLHGYRQVDVARMTGISQGRVSQILSESIESWRARRVRDTPEQLIGMKLEQLRAVRAEAWEAWVQSKEDDVYTIEEQNLRTIYRNATVNGKRVQIPGGERLRVVRAIRRVVSRLPANEYLQMVIQCLTEEMKLEGLTPELIVNFTRINNDNGQQVTVRWDHLCGRTDADPTEARGGAAERTGE
jgi:hypothetical protein